MRVSFPAEPAGYVVKCPHCDVSLSLHRGGRLVCHYCGHEEPARERCPSCGSPYIGGFKAGTQQIEELVRREFPGAGACGWIWILPGKRGHEKILSALPTGKQIF